MFVNKNITSTTHIDCLYFSINNSINLFKCKNLSIDLCVQIHSVDNETTTIPTLDFFKV